MDFAPGDEIAALSALARDIARRHPKPADPSSVALDTSLWEDLGRHGMLGLTWSSHLGGEDATPVELAVVAESLAHMGHRVPLAETVMAAHLLESSAGGIDPEMLAKVAIGQIVVIPAFEEPHVTWSAIRSSLTAHVDRGTWVLTGVKEPVWFAVDSDFILTTALDPAGDLRVFLVETPTRPEVAGPVGRIVLDRTSAVEISGSIEPGAAIRQAVDLGRIAVLAAQLGHSAAALEATVDYLKTRQQYGRKLNTFQTLAHRTADMFVRVETMRSAVYYAAMVAASGDPAASTAIARAQLVANPGARRVAEDAVQMHGALGLTSEHSVGWHLRHVVQYGSYLGGEHHASRRLRRSAPDGAPIEVLR